MVNNNFIVYGTSLSENQDLNDAFSLYQMVDSKWKLKCVYVFLFYSHYLHLSLNNFLLNNLLLILALL